VERFGAEVATEIITKNPGILSCVAASVAKQSNEEILKATDFADGLVENKEAVKLAIFAAAFALFNLVGWRIISTNPKIGAFFNL
jgi:glycerol-3-phosphate responsive antiterminator|tara:strand:- start:75 stop:329 length:255 start_codon:yes stop_codon:yes gene_type:complete